MSASARSAMPVVFLVAAVWAVFSPVVTAQFVMIDDRYMVWDNPRLVPPTLQKTAGFWTSPCKQLYTPMAYTLWSAVAALDAPAPGQKLPPLPFHLLNILLHCGATVFAFLLLRELTGEIWPAIAGAMLFAIHPLQAEPVAWVAGMNNLLCGLFGLAALWQYARYAKSASARDLVTAAILYAAALFSKPLAVTLPFMAAAIDLWIIRRPWRSVAIPFLVALAMSIPFMVVARMVQPSLAIPPVSIPQRFLVATDAIGFYAHKLLFPTMLTLDFERSPQWLLAHKSAAIFGGLILAGGLFLFFCRRTAWTRAPLAIALAGFLPVLGLTPFDFQGYSTVASRYAYLPMVGIALLAAILLQKLPRRAAVFSAIAILMILAILTFNQTQVWHDTGTLTAQQLRFDPASSTGHKHRAEWLVSINQPEAAEVEFRAAIAQILAEGRPGEGAIWYGYGNLLLRQGRYEEARRIYLDALSRAPGDINALMHNNLGIALYHLGDLAGARSEFRAALDADPNLTQARQSLSHLGPF